MNAFPTGVARVANLAGLLIAPSLGFVSLFGAEPVCGIGSCGAWYVNSPLSHIGPVPLGFFGVALWFILPKLDSVRDGVFARVGAWIFALAALGLQAYGLRESGGLCPYCLLHALVALVYALAISFGRIEQGLPLGIWSLRASGALVLALALAWVSTRRVPLDEGLASRISKMPRSEWLEASVLIQPGRDRSAPPLVAVVDLECGHCNFWLQKRLGVTEPPARDVLVVWSPLTVAGRNAVADGIAGSPKSLMHFLGSSDRRATALAPDPIRTDRAAALFRRLDLSSTPAFVLLQKSPKLLGSMQADEAVLP